MNVYMISSTYDGCCYYRIFLPAWHNGFNTTKSSLMADRDDISTTRAKLERADIVVFHRPEEREFEDLADLLIADGKKIVFDNDDTFNFDDEVHPLANFNPDASEAILARRQEAINRFLKKAHLVTTTTEILRQEYKKLNNNVVILPNCIDPDDWGEPLENKTGKVRIGMIGSVSYEYDYLHLKPLLRELSKRKDVTLVLFGLGNAKHREQNPKITKAFKDEYDFWDSIDKEQISWCPNHEYIDKLREARLDLMLIPRKVNYFNKCKSNVKFLEAAMMEVPVIAQSYDNGPYEEIDDYKNGIKISDNKDWEKAVNFMIKNEKERRWMGKNAREYAIKKYNIKDKAHMWSDAYSTLL